MIDMIVTTDDDSWYMNAGTVPRVGDEIVFAVGKRDAKRVVRLQVVAVEWNGTSEGNDNYSLKPWLRCKEKESTDGR